MGECRRGRRYTIHGHSASTSGWYAYPGAFATTSLGRGQRFVASDFTFVNAALENGSLSRIWLGGPCPVRMGERFRRGVHAGFEACGIEAQCELVEAAEALAVDFDCDVQFAHGSFVTTSGKALVATAENLWWHAQCLRRSRQRYRTVFRLLLTAEGIFLRPSFHAVRRRHPVDLP